MRNNSAPRITWQLVVAIIAAVVWISGLMIVANQHGWTISATAKRSGTATIESCRKGAFDYFCEATVEWSDGSTEGAEVRSKTQLVGQVAVTERRQAGGRRSRVDYAVVAEGFPAKMTTGSSFLLGLLVAGPLFAIGLWQVRSRRHPA